MLDEDRDALAAEYVLGTLAADERNQAEALLSTDRGFESAVRQWERRLGELNVMVEAVEPPPELWDRIKAKIDPFEPLRSAEPLRATTDTPRVTTTPQMPPATAMPTSTLVPSSPEPEKRIIPEPRPAAVVITPPVATPPIAPEIPPPRPSERSGAETIYLTRRVRRWRRATVAFGAIAALLAAYIAVEKVSPDLIPPQLRLPGTNILAQLGGSTKASDDRLVAVLQQGPTAPAFLLTFDPKTRMLYVRRVSAEPEAGRSYEVWLVSSHFSGPRSLGVVGDGDFTQRALASNYDLETLRSATYAVSLEPAGGSTKGVPTGPVLFTGKAFDSLPPNKT